ncbi:MAG: response regulator transcription factor, partial [Anaerolineales bacterium]|nr:response regulator transcription factor [Anaerolineales bacterium]
MTISYAHLLIVDTDETRARSLAEPLEAYGWYAVTICHTISSALFNLTSRPLDIVLIDVRLARANQGEFLRRVQANPRLNQIPIILLATSDQTDGVADSLELGAVDYLLTPTLPGLVKARLSTHLQQREVRAQALSCLNAFNSMK